VRGSAVRWHSWALRFAVHPRRGLELFDVAWLDGATRRPILYRASLVELMAAYGDPGFASWYPFDEGSYGLGTYGASSMTPGGDAPADAHFADAVLHDEHGRPRVVPRAAAVYERDGGLLWRHAGTACRARELVVASHTTIDNYDYVFEWTFSDDGSIRADVVFTGAMNMVPHRAGHDSLPSLLRGGVTAAEVGDRIRAPIHQHFLSFRLDFDLDPERRDMVVEVDGVPGPRDSGLNPGGEWFAATSRRLESERDARRPADAAAGRVWRVAASGPAGRGTGPGYVLLPGDLPAPLAAPDAKPRHKAAFASGQLWVTQYDSTQMYPAGDFPYRGRPDDGLPRWIEADRPLVGQDVVLWHTLGITHLPRTEDYPLMPARRAGFRLMPSGFFRANPAMDSAGRCPSTSPHSIR
jgi:primary-amine oxidase